MAGDLSNKFSEIDVAIRQGRLDGARRLLARLVGRRLPRRALLPAAIHARRLALSLLAVRLLNPVVRPKGAISPGGTPAERAEYALNLMRIGAREEALGLLEAIDPQRHGEVWLHRGFAHILEWDYAGSIPCFRSYLEREGADPYQRLVAQVNLAGALVAERRHGEADALLASLAATTAAGRHRRLLAAVLEARAQSAILRRDWREAGRWLSRARRELAPEDDLAALFLRKWEVIAGLMREPGNPGFLVALNEVRSRARVLEHWETLRDCDRAEALGRPDSYLAARVYYGTPYPGFRKALRDELPEGMVLALSYDWFPGEKRGGAIFDISTGVFSPGDREMKPGQIPHRLLTALASDFYRPHRLAALHAALFPGEWFNPLTSPFRVHRAIHRLRGELRRRRTGLAIEVRRQEVRLVGPGPGGIRVSEAGTAFGPEAVVETRLRSAFPCGEFRAEEAKARLGFSASAMHRWLRWAHRVGRLERLGAGPATRYRLKPVSRG